MTPVTITQEFYAYISGVWTLLEDVTPVSAFWGMNGNAPTDRLAGTGEMALVLNNSTGQYTPGGPSGLAGWKKGIPLKIVLTYAGETYVRFRGAVTGIQIRPNVKDSNAYVTVLDWMEYASRHPIQNYGIETDITGDELINIMLADMPVQPATKDLDVGVEVFPTAFDTVTSKTKAYSEFSKVALSELGYVYLRKDAVNGERLVFESADARNGWREISPIPVATDLSDLLLKEDGDLLLFEDGDSIALNQSGAPATLGTTLWTDFDAPYGEHLINRMTISANPRKLDTTPQILFQLDEPVQIAPGKTKRIKGTYANPDGGLPINAQDMIDPVITTDYLMNTQADGLGTDISSDLVIVTDYGTEGFVHTITNNNAKRGYITLFNCRGTGIYIYNPIEHTATDADSIAEFETESESLDQKYKNDLSSSSVFVDSVVDEFKQPMVVLNSVSFCANRSNDAMMLFLNTDIGDLRYISIPEIGLEGNYYVQGVEFSLQAGVVLVKWVVVASLSLLSGLSSLSVEFRGEPNIDAVDFGYLPRLANISTRTMSAWITPQNSGTDLFSNAICGIFSDEAAFQLLWVQADTNIAFVQKYSGVGGGQGIWQTPVGSSPANTLVHVAVVKDLDSDNVPIIYINGVAQTLTVFVAPPAGQTAFDETDVSFIVGNVNTSTINYEYAFDGEIFDVRVYDTGLSAANILTIYNSGTPSESVLTDPLTGLIFQTFVVRNDDIASYIGETLDETTTLRDAVYGAVGVPNGSPIGRAAP